MSTKFYATHLFPVPVLVSVPPSVNWWTGAPQFGILHLRHFLFVALTLWRPTVHDVCPGISCLCCHYGTVWDMWSGFNISSNAAPFKFAPLRFASCRSQPERSQFSRSAPARTAVRRSQFCRFAFFSVATRRLTPTKIFFTNIEPLYHTSFI